jgi:glycosyltransferase involved in cell wall biosynthesis
MIWIFSDYLAANGGIETYLHALATHLRRENIPFRVAVSEMAHCPVVDEIERAGTPVYRQRRVPGDRWSMRQRFLCHWVLRHLRAGDWVYCIRQPREEIYETLVDGAHRKGARVAASWMFTPDALKVAPRLAASFDRAVAKTDVVISVSRAGVPGYRSAYGYAGGVEVVPYHNLLHFPEPLPMPVGPPWRFGFLGRLDDSQKNLFALVEAFLSIAAEGVPVALDIFGGGPDLRALEALKESRDEAGVIRIHGPYDHRSDLARILQPLHGVVYTSYFEGGPCFSLLEAMQAGRYVLASAVGGIPDLYADHSEAGTLLDSQDAESIAGGIRAVIRKLELGEVRPEGPRMVYERGFTMKHAHAAWTKALGLSLPETDPDFPV